MPDYPYDPDFPFVVVTSICESQARFRNKTDASDWASDYNGVPYVGWDVIDTTPKPKIPEDARIITYYDSAGSIRFASRDSNGEREIWWVGDGTYEYTDQLLEYIGDAEITVLDERK